MTMKGGWRGCVVEGKGEDGERKWARKGKKDEDLKGKNIKKNLKKNGTLQKLKNEKQLFKNKMKKVHLQN